MINKVLILDNFDSFTFNIVDYFKQLDCHVIVYRNTVSPSKIVEDFDLLVLSPGPSVPKNAGFMFDWIKKYYKRKPIFGICLGHQALIEFFGGELMYSSPVHGKSFSIEVDGRSIYQNLPRNIDVGRYHSLSGKIIPSCFEISAKTQDQVIMSIRHKTLPIEGIQYHPESILSMNYGAGMQIIKNVVNGKLNNGSIVLNNVLNKLRKQQFITKSTFFGILKKINENELTENQILIFLVSLSYGLNNVENLYQFILSIKKFQITVPSINYNNIIDVCGTGGSGLNKINISTLVAFILASTKNFVVVKHGNKGSSGSFGSCDLVKRLGINLDYTNFNEIIKKTNLALIYAPNFYTIFHKFKNARKDYGIPTIFNIIGPFLNPFTPKKQFIGTSLKEYIPLMLEVGKLLNYEHLIIACANDGLDDITLTTFTDIFELKNGKIKNYQISPLDFNLPYVNYDSIFSLSIFENLSIAKKIIEGNYISEYTNLVLINASFIYSKFYFPELSFIESFNLLSSFLKEGKVKILLENYKKISSKSIN